MAKMRVYELAKQLDKTSKEIIDLLKEKGTEVGNHMSTLDDEAVALVESAFAPEKPVKKAAPAQQAPERPAAPAAEKAAESRPAPAEHPQEAGDPSAAPKKKKITAIIRPHNSRQNSFRNTNTSAPRRQGEAPRRPARPAQPARPQNAQARPARPAQPAEQPPRRRPVPAPEQQPVKRPAAEETPAVKPAAPAEKPAAAPVEKPAAAAPAPAPAEKPAPAPAPAKEAPKRGDAFLQTPNLNTSSEKRFIGTEEELARRKAARQAEMRRQNPEPQRPARPAGQGGNRGTSGRPTGAARTYNNGERPAGNRNQGGNRPYGGGNAGGQGGYQNRGRNTQPARGGQGAGAGAPILPVNNPKNAGKNQKGQNTRGQNQRENTRHRKDDSELRENRLARQNRQAKPSAPKQEPKEPEIRTLTLPEKLTVKELAEAMKMQPSAIVKKLFLEGKVVTINQEIDYDQAEEIALEFDFLTEKEVQVDVIEELLKDVEDKEEDMVPRPPVVCVMGHVDHGKTSLLDAIRETNVIAREFGGITQHIGAYTVEVNGQKIVFLDTPGHEAFTAMRLRGAMATDIAVLVVAADDGVMPQTIEAINHAKAAGVDIVVAINKIDKPGANVDRVKQELTEHELVPEDWGGTTICVPVSAHTGEGIENLLETILLTAEVQELKANPNRRARGLVIEAKLDKGKGPVATVLVQKGTLHIGDAVAAGSCYGKVRAMMDDKGRRVKEAPPSTPVEILGLADVPGAGEVFMALDSEKEARRFAETFISQDREKMLADTRTKMSLDDLFSQIQTGNVKELGIIVKADVQGSVEAVK